MFLFDFKFILKHFAQEANVSNWFQRKSIQMQRTWIQTQLAKKSIQLPYLILWEFPFFFFFLPKEDGKNKIWLLLISFSIWLVVMHQNKKKIPFFSAFILRTVNQLVINEHGENWRLIHSVSENQGDCLCLLFCEENYVLLEWRMWLSFCDKAVFFFLALSLPSTGCINIIYENIPVFVTHSWCGLLNLRWQISSWLIMIWKFVYILFSVVIFLIFLN